LKKVGETTLSNVVTVNGNIPNVCPECGMASSSKKKCPNCGHVFETYSVRGMLEAEDIKTYLLETV